MSDVIRIMVVDDQVEIKENIKRLLHMADEIEVVADASTGEEAIQLLDSAQPNIILMDADMPGMDGFETTAAICGKNPNIMVILMAVHRDSDLLRRAMMAGAKDFLIKPFSEIDLINTIITVFSKELRRRSSNVSKTTTEAKPQAVTRLGKVVPFYSIKGGVGKSFIAANTALVLASAFPSRRTILLDFDLSFGDSGVILNIVSRNNITSLVNDDNASSFDAFKNHICRYNDCLDVLLAPFEPQYAEEITLEHLTAILSILRKEYDYILIDTPAKVTEEMVSLLGEADMILMITTQELTNIKGIATVLGLLESCGVDKRKNRLVVNKFIDELSVSTEAISSALRGEIRAVIPNDSLSVTDSINQGIPIINKNPASPVSMAIYDVAMIIEAEVRKPTSGSDGEKKGSFMGKLKSMLGN
ncbi:MAG: hypothetical protein CVV64_08805 [Candidatus Wallbacteria bacterium HGW-Wallbacteria-1]|jgi:pilus assembly protein CpaE|uniref:Response regulatory domain-containing protein n=1 Tax=Candidatus Wallbacteria bacterium HGW-Wallbacteria-1 TaxID=2013854 RepID=A0A2N1PQ43_9BACT|nr:MAG: hypothetical protein CVV64_08805 [Candidatus Wallbacteria bacterium HGW-Wallbacteria-1]